MTPDQDIKRMNELEDELMRRFNIPRTKAFFAMMSLDMQFGCPRVTDVPWEKVRISA
jgi:hypothetical protein